MLNFHEAFTFPFRDPAWGQKFVIGAIFTFLSIFILPIPVLYGFLIELTQRVRNNNPNTLPEWKDPGIKFLLGLKYMVTLFIYSIPLILIIVIFLSLSILFWLTTDDLNAQSDGLAAISLLIMIVIPYSLFLLVITPVITIEFACREKIIDGLNLGRILRIFGNLWKEVLMICLITFALEIAAGIGIVLFIAGILFTSFYASLIIFHLYGQISCKITH